MKRHRKTWIFLLIVVTIIQFIQPKKNLSSKPADNDITNVYSVPAGIRETLTAKCYDCHSNNTNYSWYSHIQPLGWWLAANIHEGKTELNFSEFRRYPGDQATAKLQAIAEALGRRGMPVLLHPYAEIPEEDERAVAEWVAGLVQGSP